MTRDAFRAAVAVVTAFLLAAPAARILVAQTAPSTARPTGRAPQTAAPAAPATGTAPQGADAGWPRDYQTAGGGQLRLFQPQVSSWDGQNRLVAYQAVSFTAPTATAAALGTIKLEATTSVALSERLVNFSNVTLTESHFPDLTKEQQRDVVSAIELLVPEGAFMIALDRVLASVDKSSIIPKNVEGVKSEPPVIFYSTTPAILVNIDSEPVWSPIKDNDLKFAVNTNWDLFQYVPTSTYYLRYNDSWLSSADVKGPWKPAGTLPASFKTLPADTNWDDVRAALPGRALSSGSTPRIFVSTTPAELLLLRGAPTYLLVAGTTDLLWVSNSDNDLFRLGRTGPAYYLVSGRWFSAPDFNGPWAFATPSLPETFKKIPLSHPRSRVLASVPGTAQAAEAVLLAQVPQTARVDKRQVKAPEVEFQGDPTFQPIEQTTVSRAVNTDKDIIKVGDIYYMCFQGVWFMAKSPTGPWEVTGSVPKEIYEIPLSSPSYNVTNVTVVESNDDAVVFATAAAYTGVMVAYGCAVWGTGYYYPPYIGYGGFYPAYYPYYPSYGFHASYNPWTGTYSRGAVAYGPYGGAGVGAKYNPRTGTYARGAAAWGPYGARGVAEAYNPRTGAYGATRQGSGVYGSWGQTGVQRGNDWATTSRVTNRVTGTTTRGTQTSNGGAAITRRGPQGTGGVARTGDGDIYAGRDGNVYKRQDGGGWEQAGGNRPTPVDSSTAGQLNRDSAARTEGAQRTRDAGHSSVRSGTTGSYRPSGGGARPRGGGGGGRRR